MVPETRKFRWLIVYLIKDLTKILFISLSILISITVTRELKDKRIDRLLEEEVKSLGNKRVLEGQELEQ
jgi:hypothetical protein